MKTIKENIRGIIIILLLFNLSSILYSQNKIIKLEDICITIPYTWGAKNESKEENTYKIACNSPDSVNIITITYTDDNIDPLKYFDYNVKRFKEKALLLNTKWHNQKISKTNSNPSLEISMEGKLGNLKYKGKFICYKEENRFFCIYYHGYENFYESKTVNEIIESITKLKWNTYNINEDLTINIPSTLEVRKVDSPFSNIIDSIYTESEYSITKPIIAFQPEGTTDMDKSALELYSTILIYENKIEEGQTIDNSYIINLTKDDRATYEKNYKEEVTKRLNGIQAKVLKWMPLELVIINNIIAFRMSFIRQLKDNTPVKVEDYFIPYNRSVINIISSYRIKEEDLWADDLHKAINSLQLATSINK